MNNRIKELEINKYIIRYIETPCIMETKGKDVKYSVYTLETIEVYKITKDIHKQEYLSVAFKLHKNRFTEYNNYTCQLNAEEHISFLMSYYDQAKEVV